MHQGSRSNPRHRAVIKGLCHSNGSQQKYNLLCRLVVGCWHYLIANDGSLCLDRIPQHCSVLVGFALILADPAPI
jgi:hypothetical protein